MSVSVLMVNDLAVDAGDRSGAEVYLARLSEGLERLGVRVEMLAGEVKHTGWQRVLDFYDPGARALVSATARRFGADLVHHHNVLRELSVSVLGAPPELPCVLSVHDGRLIGHADAGQPWLVAAVDALAKRRLDVAIARRAVTLALPVSRFLADGLLAAGFPNVQILPALACPPAQPPPPPSLCREVLFIGRITPDKGWRVLLDAWRLLEARFPEFSLTLAGAGGELDDLRAAAATLRRVRVAGRVDSAAVERLLSTARVVVVPSIPSLRPEGSPLVAVEAAMAGRPLVVSDDPGCVETAGPLGAQVTPAGDTVGLANAISSWLTDPVAADEAGARAALQARARHSVDTVTATLLGHYEDLLARRARLADG